MPEVPRRPWLDQLATAGALDAAGLHPPRPLSPQRPMPRPVLPVVHRVDPPRLPVPLAEPADRLRPEIISQPGSAHFLYPYVTIGPNRGEKNQGGGHWSRPAKKDAPVASCGLLVTNTPARWILCFLALPALWCAVSVATGMQAVLMIPAAVVVALLSTLTGYGSGRGKLAAFGYFLGTCVMMAVAFAIAVATIFTIICGDGSTEGVC